ncbi:MAG: carbamoyltransferase HypF, partial [Synechococcaceae cyanobacterium]|nr:carbamoyltransferase HypF [Synechococcaceae cyanobacterium]
MKRARLRLVCRGVVQGVGLRPWLHRLATELGLTGQLSNSGAGVEVDLEGERGALEQLLQRLSSERPPAVRLEPLEPQWLPAAAGSRSALPQGVRITASPPQPLGAGLFAPSLVADRAPCPDCLRELNDPTDRRHRYPFISCCHCGPRFSIATAEPFCRAHTSLAAFRLCPACQREFNDPADRRFHAETISCPACGPRLRLWDAEGRPEPISDPASVLAAEPIAAAAALLLNAGILALQGVGGFQLLVDATDADAVQRLRQRKCRPARPFAVLVETTEQLAGWLELEAAALAALQDPAAPIVLLPRRDAGWQALPGVAPDSAALGVMLPASPLHWLLARACGRPLVATSGNPSGEPLCIDPAEALRRLGGIADAFLVHDRAIARPLDDSLLQPIEGRLLPLRRARGYAPQALELRLPAGEPSVLLALGGDLKAAPALAIGQQVWPATHLGDLADSHTERRLREALGERAAGERRPPEAIGADGHPGYVSRSLAERSGTTWQAVPHHLAHALAVLAELPASLADGGALLACCMDGLGYGAGGDHQLRGCELLLLEPGRCSSGTDPISGSAPPVDGEASPIRWQRLACLRPLLLPGGESALREPRRAALGLLLSGAPDGRLLQHAGAAACRQAFSAEELLLLQAAAASGCNTPRASGGGRLFDALASLLDLVQLASYEGEAGLRLQGLASHWRQRNPGPAAPLPEPLLPLRPGGGLPLGQLDWQPLLQHMLEAIAAGAPTGALALRFHLALAEAIAIAAREAAQAGAWS